ncbi:u3 small nucleolar rna-associated protein 18homolog [Pelomyxa schiedti]|nr:u3 small nucleolar rna-associated protein 18homolog [Pelomyxa schiedti]
MQTPASPTPTGLFIDANTDFAAKATIPGVFFEDKTGRRAHVRKPKPTIAAESGTPALVNDPQREALLQRASNAELERDSTLDSLKKSLKNTKVPKPVASPAPAAPQTAKPQTPSSLKPKAPDTGTMLMLEEERLTNKLFGKKELHFSTGETIAVDGEDEDDEREKVIQELEAEDEASDEEDNDREELPATESGEEDQAVWHDPDDEQMVSTRYGRYSASDLRAQREQFCLQPTTWARIKRPRLSSSKDVTDTLIGERGAALLASTSDVLESQRGVLTPGYLGVKNIGLIPSSGQPSSVQFHLNEQLVMFTTLQGHFLMHRIGNNMFHPTARFWKFHNFSCLCSAFTADYTEALVTGDQPYFFSVDVESEKITKIPYLTRQAERAYPHFSVSPDNNVLAFSGEDGNALIVSRASKQVVGKCRVPSGSLQKTCFSSNGSRLFALDSRGRVTCFDTRTYMPVYSYSDQGNVQSHAFALSPNDKWQAVGSDVGVLNLYQSDALPAKPHPKPLWSSLALTTAVTHISFNQDSNLLAWSSPTLECSLRIAHVPSQSIFCDFPMGKLKSKVQTFAISPSSKYIAIGIPTAVRLHSLDPYNL